MGVWGPGLFDDDVACDVRGEYIEQLRAGIEDEDATRRVIEKFGLSIRRPDRDPVAWLALALTQSKVGRLDTAAQERALAILDDGADLAHWERENTALAPRRRAALKRARARLAGSQPDRKEVRTTKAAMERVALESAKSSPRRSKRFVSGLAAGDVLGFRRRRGWALVRIASVVSYERRFEDLYLVPLQYRGKELPDPTALEALDDVAAPTPPTRDPSSKPILVIQGFNERWADNGFVLVGKISRRSRPERIMRKYELLAWTKFGWPGLAKRLRAPMGPVAKPSSPTKKIKRSGLAPGEILVFRGSRRCGVLRVVDVRSFEPAEVVVVEELDHRGEHRLDVDTLSGCPRRAGSTPTFGGSFVFNVETMTGPRDWAKAGFEKLGTTPLRNSDDLNAPDVLRWWMCADEARARLS